MRGRGQPRNHPPGMGGDTHEGGVAWGMTRAQPTVQKRAGGRLRCPTGGTKKKHPTPPHVQKPNKGGGTRIHCNLVSWTPKKRKFTHHTQCQISYNINKRLTAPSTSVACGDTGPSADQSQPTRSNPSQEDVQTPPKKTAKKNAKKQCTDRGKHKKKRVAKLGRSCVRRRP